MEKLLAVGILCLLALGIFSILSGNTSLMDLFFQVFHG